MSSQANSLSTTVSQLLQLTRLQKGLDSEQDPGLVDLNLLVEQTISDQEDFASSKNIIIKLQKQSKPVYVTGDSVSLQPVFHNLIENGIIYSKPDTTVRVSISVKADQCFVTVEDQGLGIPKAEQQRIFERFYRLDTGRSLNKAGTGLGLSIVRAAIQAHKGKITVKSTVNKGSVFKVSLPLRSAVPKRTR
ncbi:MAG: hypothetical protein CMQ11_10975 [Gammaproteobacteria bacterium]|nr:hypothetical protein [Gammaproteobacteria bacterium]